MTSNTGIKLLAITLLTTILIAESQCFYYDQDPLGMGEIKKLNLSVDNCSCCRDNVRMLGLRRGLDIFKRKARNTVRDAGNGLKNAGNTIKNAAGQVFDYFQFYRMPNGKYCWKGFVGKLKGKK